MQLRSDFLVLYPTDTLYGLGVDATDARMVERLKKLKGRGDTKPFTIAVDSLEMMEKYAEVTPLAENLAKSFLPGPLTLVLCAKPGLRTSGVVGEDGSVGIRIPNHPQALRLIRELGKPVTVTSANVSGMQTEKTPEKILAQFGEKSSWITHVINAGELPLSKASTLVDARGEEPIVLREGTIPSGAVFVAS